MYDMEELPEPMKPAKPEPAAKGGDEDAGGDDDGGDDDEWKLTKLEGIWKNIKKWKKDL